MEKQGAQDEKRWEGDLNDPLGRVEAAGGGIVAPKTDIGENGFFAFILDTEGNRVGLYSNG